MSLFFDDWTNPKSDAHWWILDVLASFDCKIDAAERCLAEIVENLDCFLPHELATRIEMQRILITDLGKAFGRASEEHSAWMKRRLGDPAFARAEDEAHRVHLASIEEDDDSMNENEA